MISIFVFYSKDRFKAFEAFVYSLKKMDLYFKCQKLLIIDGFLDEKIDNDFEQIEVPRINGEFCWADMWNAGVFSSKYDILWYLDCDRILPSKYLNSALDYVDNNTFVFTSNHYLMLKEMSSEETFKWSNMSEEEFFSGTLHVGKFAYEPRYPKFLDGPGKNVMSGNTIFSKETYKKLGGVDRWYRGHGAFADTDFHAMAHLHGCKMIDLMYREIHYFHNKINEIGLNLNKKELNVLSLKNYVYFIKKWNLSKVLFDNMATSLDLNFSEMEEIWNNVIFK